MLYKSLTFCTYRKLPMQSNLNRIRFIVYLVRNLKYDSLLYGIEIKCLLF